MNRPPSRRHWSHSQAARTDSTIRSVRASSGSSLDQAFWASPFATRFGHADQKRSKLSRWRCLSTGAGDFFRARDPPIPAPRGSVDGSPDGSMGVWGTTVSACPVSGVRLPCPACPVACPGCPGAQSVTASPWVRPVSGCLAPPMASRYRSVWRPAPVPGRCSTRIRPRFSRSAQTRRRWRTERPHIRATRPWLGQQTPSSSACSASASSTSFGVEGSSSDQTHRVARSATTLDGCR